MIPIFSKLWWKYTLINCAMFQAQISFNDYTAHQRFERDHRAPSQVVAWYPVETRKQWQERYKDIGIGFAVDYFAN